MSKFNSGDLAIIIGATYEQTSSNIGKVVKLLHTVKPGETVRCPNGQKIRLHPDTDTETIWLVHCESGLLSYIKDKGVAVETKYTFSLERLLMPLKGDFEPDEELKQLSTPQKANA